MRSRLIMRPENSSKLCLNTPCRLSAASTDGSSVTPSSALMPLRETPCAAASFLKSARKASKPPGGLQVAAKAGAESTDVSTAAERSLANRMVAPRMRKNGPGERFIRAGERRQRDRRTRLSHAVNLAAGAANCGSAPQDGTASTPLGRVPDLA